MGKFLGGFFMFWSRVSTKYNLIKNNEEKRDTSISLGVRSIIQAIVGFVVIGLCVWGISACVGHLNSIEVMDGTYDFPFMTIIGIVLLALVIVVFFFQSSVNSLLLMIYQFKLNNRAVRWVALAVWLASVVGMVVLAVLLFV